MSHHEFDRFGDRVLVRSKFNVRVFGRCWNSSLSNARAIVLLPELGSTVSQTTRPAWPIKQARSAAVTAAGHNVVSCVCRAGSEVCGCIMRKVSVVHLGG